MATVSAGCELEVFAEEQPCPTAFSEYYSGQWEINDTFASVMTSRNGVRATAECLRMAVYESLLTLEDRVGQAYVDPFATWRCARGVVFNGLHVHLGGDVAHVLLSRDTLWKRFEALVTYEYVARFGVDARFILSHHIWGATRPTDHSWKSKDRYLPVAKSNIGTVEVRLFHARVWHERDAVASILHDSYYNSVLAGGQDETNIGSQILKMMKSFPADLPSTFDEAHYWLDRLEEFTQYCKNYGINMTVYADIDDDVFFVKEMNSRIVSYALEEDY